MTKRVILFCLACGLLVGSSGCALLDCLIYAPFGPDTACDPTYCFAPCGPPCGPIRGPACGPARVAACGPAPVTACAPPCGPVGEPACEVPCAPACEPACADPCGPVCGLGCYHCCGPLAWIFRLFRPVCWCGPSCGEIYWGDFHGDPPDCCDPCDRLGNYTGGQPWATAPATTGSYVEPAPQLARPHKAAQQ